MTIIRRCSCTVYTVATRRRATRRADSRLGECEYRLCSDRLEDRIIVIVSLARSLRAWRSQRRRRRRRRWRRWWRWWHAAGVTGDREANPKRFIVVHATPRRPRRDRGLSFSRYRSSDASRAQRAAHRAIVLLSSSSLLLLFLPFVSRRGGKTELGTAPRSACCPWGDPRPGPWSLVSAAQ